MKKQPVTFRGLGSLCCRQAYTKQNCVAIHSFKWVKFIQICQNGGQLFSNLAHWCYGLFSTCLKADRPCANTKCWKKRIWSVPVVRGLSQALHYFSGNSNSKTKTETITSLLYFFHIRFHSELRSKPYILYKIDSYILPNSMTPLN